MNLFLDLDGTLSDSSEGILKSFQFALVELGLPAVEENVIASLIGASLRESFALMVSKSSEELIEQAVSKYRERYADVGLFENELYPGIKEMLVSAKEQGFGLFVVTAKPKIYAEKIVDHFGIGDFFVEVYGPELSGAFDNKAELIEHILRSRKLVAARCVMIGDRATDIEAGLHNNTGVMGVSYGFGSREELINAGAKQIADNASQIVRHAMEYDSSS